MAINVTKTRKILANNIVYFRVQKNWSQEYSAKLLGQVQATFPKWRMKKEISQLII